MNNNELDERAEKEYIEIMEEFVYEDSDGNRVVECKEYDNRTTKEKVADFKTSMRIGLFTFLLLTICILTSTIAFSFHAYDEFTFKGKYRQDYNKYYNHQIFYYETEELEDEILTEDNLCVVVSVMSTPLETKNGGEFAKSHRLIVSNKYSSPIDNITIYIPYSVSDSIVVKYSKVEIDRLEVGNISKNLNFEEEVKLYDYAFVDVSNTIDKAVVYKTKPLDMAGHSAESMVNNETMKCLVGEFNEGFHKIRIILVSIAEVLLVALLYLHLEELIYCVVVLNELRRGRYSIIDGEIKTEYMKRKVTLRSRLLERLYQRRQQKRERKMK